MLYILSLFHNNRHYFVIHLLVKLSKETNNKKRLRILPQISKHSLKVLLTASILLFPRSCQRASLTSAPSEQIPCLSLATRKFQQIYIISGITSARQMLVHPGGADKEGQFIPTRPLLSSKRR